MSILTTKANARQELLRSLLPGVLTEEDALLWMLLLHTHAIHLKPGAIAADGQDLGSDPVILPAETQRGAAEIMASLWPDRNDAHAQYGYWYKLYNSRTPYETLHDVPEPMKTQLLVFREALARDPRVAAVVEED